MKLFSKIALTILSLAGVLLLLAPIAWFPAFYDVRYMGVGSLVGALAIYFLPKIFRVHPHSPDAESKNQAVDLFQFLLSFIIFSNALGDLGLYQLYKVGFEFDKFIHFLNPFFTVLLIPIILQKRFSMRWSFALSIACMLAFLGGIGWEVFEYLCDNVFKTHLYGVYGSDISSDTKFDLIFDAAGVVSGLLLGIFTKKRKA